MEVTLARYFDEKKRVIDDFLDRSLPPATAEPRVLHEAMRYAVFPGGKRLRPILTLASAETVGADPMSILPAAAALELIHCYSLVHDDLPALDNDEVRRGRASCHRKFGEAAAILVGDALLTQAFALLVSQRAIHPSELIQRVVQAIGCAGMISGQMLDLEPPGAASREAVEEIYRLKTGKLLALCAEVGAMAGGRPRDIELLGAYAERLGVAFQIADDIEDEVQGRPGALNYPHLFGMERARSRAAELLAEAIGLLGPFKGCSRMLVKIAEGVAEKGGFKVDGSQAS